MEAENLFKNGSTWIRADFHLHTKADKEFVYSGEENSFVREYAAALSSAGIQLGVISNHNKFDKNEFKSLQKKARKQEICLLPGVEISVNDGANGIHTIIVFSGQWLENGNDYINPFITSMFPGKSPNEYQNENGRSDKNILQLVEELEKTARDYFLIFAHVEQKSGLWKEMNGGKLSDFREKRYATVIKRTLGFQKVRTHDVPDRICRTKVQSLLGSWYPAEVEGSDCKSVNDIGRGEKCWIKLGDFTFEAVKFALLDHNNRTSAKEPQKYSHSHIKKVCFEGGVLGGQVIEFSPELNTLIGIRGSGKSSVLESLRYALDIPLGEKSVDEKYKHSLVAHTLGSGGKAVVTAVDRHGQEYEISRILNEQAEVFINSRLHPGISIRETVIHKPIYFGQKDLASTGEGFENDLLEKLLGEKLADIRRRITEQRQIASEAVKRLLTLSGMEEKKKEYEQKKQDAEFRLRIYKDKGIAEKLQKQTDFDNDERRLKKISEDVRAYISTLSELVTTHEDELKNHTAYKSKQNTRFFSEFFDEYQKIIRSFDKVKAELDTIQDQYRFLQEKLSAFAGLKKTATDEFARVRRSLEEDLKSKGVNTLNIEEFPNLQKTVETAKQMLEAFRKQEEQKESVRNELLIALSELNRLWQQEFQFIQNELDRVNAKHSELKIHAAFKGDKDSFLNFMKQMFKGSKIRENTLQGLVNSYTDFIAIYKDWEQAKAGAGSSPEIFERYFFDNLGTLLTWQTPSKFTIAYREKELRHHSLGQRASALILFVLSQEENDVVIIDQPEDDLDNQTIYEDVIKLIRLMKPKTQFIFATHNANIPVLGDAEMIHSSRYAEEKISLKSGSIDSPVLQKEIVDIMEGGEDAFNRRKEIYRLWKPQN